MKQCGQFTVLFSLLILLISCKSESPPFACLEGKWEQLQQDGAANGLYEYWQSAEGNSWIGEGFRMKDGEKTLNENLSISLEDEGWVFTANVINQNGGRSIPFKAKSLTNECSFCFSNPKHDFPNLICYELVDERLIVSISNDKGMNFEIKMRKIE